MENKILYQIIIGGIFYFLVALALYTFLKEPKQILKDFLDVTISSFLEKFLFVFLAPILIIALPLILIFRNKKSSIQPKNTSLSIFSPFLHEFSFRWHFRQVRKIECQKFLRAKILDLQNFLRKNGRIDSLFRNLNSSSI